MSTAKKPVSNSPGNRNSLTDPSSSPRVSARQSPNPSASTNGLGRSPSGRQSPVSARAAARKPGRSNLSMSSVPKMLPRDPSEEDARAENAALIEDLKEQLQKAETVSEQYQKQLGVLQMRLDEAVSEQGRLEEDAHEKESRIESLNDQVRDHARQIRDLEQGYDTERTAMLKEKDLQTAREEELQSSIQRLKETIAQKDLRINVDNDRNLSRSPSLRNRSSDNLENGQFAPSSQLQRSPSRNNSNLILQKDKLIESLRLELAESQIKLVEMENMGGGRQQELERDLLEARMSNARLMEDNESYQLLLSEKTLNGDFTKGDFMHEATPEPKQSTTSLGSLADELESIGEGEESESQRPEDGEVKALKDQNKALTLYIERIIGRLLQHEGFETILDKNETENPLANTPKPINTDKELPLTPGKDDGGPTFLERAKSVVSGQTGRPRPKPRAVSQIRAPAPDTIVETRVTANEDPNTAPRIPLGRSQSVRTNHRRARSDQAEGVAAAAVVGQMYRGTAPGRSPSSGPMSPGFSPTMGPNSRQSPFVPGSGPNSTSGGRVMSMSSLSGDRGLSSAGSVSSDRSGEVGSTEGTNSSPRQGAGMNNYTGAVMTQNKLRPLRLVQENKEMESGDQGGSRTSEDDDTARKKANRGSWIPWFNRSKEEEAALKNIAQQ
ncbi:hypothetical protein FQN54_001042 [Arachnomyces sp. PD_36]|nr:hypothetical protein FQN54_001042 [Arachnomyces sp. PD_36]